MLFHHRDRKWRVRLRKCQKQPLSDIKWPQTWPKCFLNVRNDTFLKYFRLFGTGHFTPFLRKSLFHILESSIKMGQTNKSWLIRNESTLQKPKTWPRNSRQKFTNKRWSVHYILSRRWSDPEIPTAENFFS